MTEVVVEERERNRTDRSERVREALVLRASVLALLSRVAPTPAEHESLLAASAPTWNLLLTVECCAIALAARIREGRWREQLSADCLAELDSAEQREMQRVMAARAVLRELDDIAAFSGTTMVVLKGAVAAAEQHRTPVDLGDVDVLVRVEDGKRIWDALVTGGWSTKAIGLDPDDPRALERNHYAPLVPTRIGLPVELHHKVSYGDRLEDIDAVASAPLPGYTALRRLVGQSAIITPLRHAAIKHPFRRGHLRDLVLCAEELAQLEPGTLSNVMQSFDGDDYAPELREMLLQADAVRAGRRAADSTATQRFVAWKYATLIGAGAAFRWPIPGWFSIGVLTLERSPIRRAEYREMLASAFRAVPADSPFRPAAIGRSSSGIASAILWTGRVAYRCALTGFLAAVGWHVRRSVSAIVLRTRESSVPDVDASGQPSEAPTAEEERKSPQLDR